MTEENEVISGSISIVEPERIWIAFGDKSDGVIPLPEWSDVKLSSLEGVAEVGDSVRVVILDQGNDDTPPRLSRKQAVDDHVFARLQGMMEREEPFPVRILVVVKGGLVADVDGLRAFLPASLLDIKFVEDLTPFAGNMLDVMISELDIEHRRVILSRKKVLEKQEREKHMARLKEFHVGDVVQGKVARLTSFGAFIDLGDVDGLLHVSEMSWGRVSQPSEVVSIGDVVTVKVLQVAPEEGRISLSMKTEQNSPWHAIADRYHAGDIVKGTVKRLSSFGAFVELEPGVEGLVHVSQIAHQRVAHPADVLKPGDEVMVKILDIKPEEGRISLSIRDAQKSADKKAVSNYEKKQETDTHGATLGELVGDLLREKFKL